MEALTRERESRERDLLALQAAVAESELSLQSVRARQELLEAIVGKRHRDALRLAHMADDDVSLVVDGLGCTALHHAARAIYSDVVNILLKRAPTLANMVSHSTATPARWTALHCATNENRRKDNAVSEEQDEVA